jgi:ribonuclease Z
MVLFPNFPEASRVGAAMTPMLHPRLVNGRFGDPALFVEMLHRREALLFDAGDLSALSTRDLLRVTHLFVSHMHMDHFIGFDPLLRVHVGREKAMRVLGPAGIIDRAGHKLQGYDWDLAERYQTDLIFEVVEVGENGPEAAARFRFKRRFERDPLDIPADWNEVVGLKLETALLEHHGPCLGFAVSEPAHVNVWKSRLEQRGLAAGKWLQELKAAVLAGLPDCHEVDVKGHFRPLGELRGLITVSQGQKIAYVTDVADTPANRAAIVTLAQDADLFFLESRFAAADAEQAVQRAHLTTCAAGEIARAAGVRRLEAFHFSPRYEGDEQRMLDEVAAAFASIPAGINSGECAA